MIKVYVLNTGSYAEVAGGTKLSRIAADIAGQLPFRPICARVNNKTEGLNYEVYSPKDVEFLDRTSDSGQRVYVRSLCMMLYRAVTLLYPGARVCLEHSVSRGYFCRIKGADVPVDADALVAKMHELSRAALPFRRREERRTEVIELFRRQGLADKVKLLETIHDPYVVYHTLDGLADMYYGCLAPDTSMIDVFALTPYHDGFLLRGFDPANPAVPPQPVTQEKMFRAFTDYLEFNRVLGVSNVGEMNAAVDAGKARDIINVAEALHEKYITKISDEITRRYHRGGARFVLIAGPSSSGKTTTCKRLAVQLMTNLLKPVTISLDNYFVDRQHTPRDAGGDYDYENLYALDLEAFNADLNALLEGKEVKLPTYSFETGQRFYKGDSIRLDEGSILLIEGIHGLNPDLTRQVPESQKFRVYVSALTTLSIDDHNWVRTTDYRLLRRMIRDYKYRGTTALETLRRWPKVRAGEERWIFPYQENADATFNSSLIFELGVIKDTALEVLRGVTGDCPEYATAYRLLKFLSYFRAIPPEAVPPTSLLREFLGGSSFHY